MAKVIVVGGSGFIGSHLVRLLVDNGHSVKIVDIAKSLDFPEIWAMGDVRDRDTLVAHFAGADVVYNLAAVHRDDVREVDMYHDVNVNGAVALAGACADSGVRELIFTSSVAVYGPSSKAVSEDSPTNPESPYGISKLAAEGVYRDWQQGDAGRHLVVVRPTVVFGEGNRGNVYNLARQISGRRFLMVGGGQNRKSMAYVQNVADLLSRILPYDKRAFELLNYVDKPDLSMNELVDLIYRALNMPRPRMRLPYFAGLAAGLLGNITSRLTGRQLPINVNRIRKFCASSVFEANHPWVAGRGTTPLVQAIESTVQREFEQRAAHDTVP